MQYLKQLKIELVETDIENPLKGQVREPEDVYGFFKDMEREDKEKLVAVYLNARLLVNSFEVLTIGGMEFGYVSPKEIFKGALLTNSPNFILLHNHPSGDPEPSPEDRAAMRKVKAQATIMDIHMVDFIIVGRNDFWSLYSHTDYVSAVD